MKGLPRREIIFLYSVTKRYEDCYIFFDNFIDNVNFLYGACLVGKKTSSRKSFWLSLKPGFSGNCTPRNLDEVGLRPDFYIPLLFENTKKVHANLRGLLRQMIIEVTDLLF